MNIVVLVFGCIFFCREGRILITKSALYSTPKCSSPVQESRASHFTTV